MAKAAVVYIVGVAVLFSGASLWRSPNRPRQPMLGRPVDLPRAWKPAPVKQAVPEKDERPRSALKPPARPSEKAEAPSTPVDPPTAPKPSGLAEERPIPAPAAKPKEGKNGGKAKHGEDIFAELFIPHVELEIPKEGINRLRRDGRTYVKATIREGTTVYTNVAIRLKGGPGSFRPIDDRPSFTVNFDKFEEGQKFHGLKKIHLNNSPQDPSLLSEKMSRELFDAAGVPTPRAGHAAVRLNGRPMGVYVLIEGVNKQFLKRYFSDVTGNVYDGHSGSDVTDSLPTDSGDNPDDHWRLKALAAAVRRPAATRLSSLENVLDIDRFLSFLAMEAILWHHDGYTMNRNNWRVYHDRDTDKMVFFPQGMDQMLNQTTGPIIPQLNGLVARAVLEIPELRKRYLARAAELATNVFRTNLIVARINEVAAKIEETLAETDAKAAAEHRKKADGLIRRFRRRSTSLDRQLFPANGPTASLASLQSPAAWEPRTDLGEATLERETGPDGKVYLRVSTATGCTASWRSQALLERGKYRFEGRVKRKGVALDLSDPRAGVGLRVSGHRTLPKASGDSDWTTLVFDFEVAEEKADVELVCELRANAGEAWFDPGSLRVSPK